MKKFLCYIALILLIGCILAPPLLRKFYKDKEVVVEEITERMTCYKEGYTITSTYVNKEIQNIRFEHPKEDPNLDSTKEEYAHEFNLYNNLKNASNVTTKDTVGDLNGAQVNMIEYFLIFKSAPSDVITNLANHRYLLDEQKTSYINNGYECQVSELKY